MVYPEGAKGLATGRWDGQTNWQQAVSPPPPMPRTDASWAESLGHVVDMIYGPNKQPNLHRVLREPET